MPAGKFHIYKFKKGLRTSKTREIVLPNVKSLINVHFFVFLFVFFNLF